MVRRFGRATTAELRVALAGMPSEVLAMLGRQLPHALAMALELKLEMVLYCLLCLEWLLGLWLR